MSDNTRREAASTDLPHPARHPHPSQCSPPLRGGWPDARTAEVLLSGSGSCRPPTEPAGRLVRLLAAARDGRAPLDPAREAAAVAAFRTAAARRKPAGGGARGGPLAALRHAFARRGPRMMAAAMVSALALGGVAVGMAAATRSFAPGEGAGTAPNGTRPPAAVSTDGSQAGPWTAAPGAAPAAPSVHTGAGEHRTGTGRKDSRAGRSSGGGFGHGAGDGSGHDRGCGHTAGRNRTAGTDHKPGHSGSWDGMVGPTGDGDHRTGFSGSWDDMGGRTGGGDHRAGFSGSWDDMGGRTGGVDHRAGFSGGGDRRTGFSGTRDHRTGRASGGGTFGSAGRAAGAPEEYGASTAGKRAQAEQAGEGRAAAGPRHTRPWRLPTSQAGRR